MIEEKWEKKEKKKIDDMIILFKNTFLFMPSIKRGVATLIMINHDFSGSEKLSVGLNIHYFLYISVLKFKKKNFFLKR